MAQSGMSPGAISPAGSSSVPRPATKPSTALPRPQVLRHASFVPAQRAEDQTPQRSARPRDKQNGDEDADAASAHEAQNKHQYKRTDQTAEEYPSPDRRIEDYFAAARLLGGIRLLLWRWSGL